MDARESYDKGDSCEYKVAVVTGASRGLGLAICRLFSQNSIKVYMIATNAGLLRREVRNLERQEGNPTCPVALRVDLNNEEEIRRGFSYVGKREGRIDILVNNAATFFKKPFVDTTIDECRDLFRVNFEGAFLCCQEAFRVMRTGEGGCIVNIGATAGLRGFVDHAAYVAAKHALVGLTKVLALEGQLYGIRVLLLCPGLMRTAMGCEASGKKRDRRMISADEVARVVLFMVSLRNSAEVDSIVVRSKVDVPFL